MTIPAELRTLAREVERLGTTGRMDPETIYIEKRDIADRIRQVANILDKTNGKQSLRHRQMAQDARPASTGASVVRVLRTAGTRDDGDCG